MIFESYTWGEIDAALDRHMRKDEREIVLMRLQSNRLMARLNANAGKTKALIDRSENETGAQWLRTQEDITALFAERDALSSEVFKK